MNRLSIAKHALMVRFLNLCLLLLALIILSCKKDSPLDTPDQSEPKDTANTTNGNQNGNPSTDTTKSLPSIKIKVTNLKSSKGELRIGLYNNGQDFPQKDKTYKAKIIEVEGGSMECKMDSIPPGTYALSLHHDENENGKIDQNTLGIPQEGFGFSNNASGTFGPPTYDRAAFEVTQENTNELNIKLIHY